MPPAPCLVVRVIPLEHADVVAALLVWVAHVISASTTAAALNLQQRVGAQQRHALLNSETHFRPEVSKRSRRHIAGRQAVLWRGVLGVQATHKEVRLAVQFADNLHTVVGKLLHCHGPANRQCVGNAGIVKSSNAPDDLERDVRQPIVRVLLPLELLLGQENAAVQATASQLVTLGTCVLIKRATVVESQANHEVKQASFITAHSLARADQA
jgi:hypothetical protein